MKTLNINTIRFDIKPLNVEDHQTVNLTFSIWFRANNCTMQNPPDVNYLQARHPHSGY
ncbi:hypothetical protein JCM19235_4713 [Vibrio maritimus]|uniref:Uncharacterized protein n=1 Tax=Vibrio maritimus TaxID=990268 RepID=A0A090S4T7_9VIBR|nr:hypothetical protein JCM19235_4713 [Vibrio maritimus]